MYMKLTSDLLSTSEGNINVDMAKKTFKIVFLQTVTVPYMGIMSISAVLKKYGFLTNVFSIDYEKQSVVQNILKAGPDLLACSVMTPDVEETMKVINAVKEKKQDAFTVMGGPHTTFLPEILNTEKNLDAVCIGEGEHAMLELASSLKGGRVNNRIKNLHFKQNGEIIRNEARSLIEDLDSLPFPDRDLYFEKYHFLFNEMIDYSNSRGCPFNCSYCHNKGMRNLYKGKGSWLRFRKNENVIEEIKATINKYPAKYVRFLDDTLNVKPKRFKEFLLMYKKEVNVPFVCNLRIDLANEEQIEQLKNAGVSRISIGIEHGDEDFRKKVLYRDYKNQQILDFSKWVNKRGIRIHTFNIMGFPGETLDMAFSTVEINAKIKPTMAYAHILNPYPGTDILEYAKSVGSLNELNLNALSAHQPLYLSGSKVKSVIKDKDIPEIINLRCFFMILVWYPWMKPLVKVLIKIPNNRFYEFLWLATGSFRLSWKFAGWMERRTLLKKLFKRLV